MSDPTIQPLFDALPDVFAQRRMLQEVMHQQITSQASFNSGVTGQKSQSDIDALGATFALNDANISYMRRALGLEGVTNQQIIAQGFVDSGATAQP